MGRVLLEGDKFLFAEAKRVNSGDVLQTRQKSFLEAALSLGFDETVFVVVEWDVDDLPRFARAPAGSTTVVGSENLTENADVEPLTSSSDECQKLRRLLDSIEIVESELAFQVMRLDEYVSPRTQTELEHLEDLRTGYGTSRKYLVRLKRYQEKRLERLQKQEPAPTILPDVILCYADGRRIVVADPATIVEAIHGLAGGDDSFLILERDDMTYVQTSGGTEEGFILEYQDGSLDEHYQAVDVCGRGAVVNTFLKFAQGERSWRDLITWVRIDV